jgi:chloramphenicol O-acetyltransferase type A
MQHFIENSHAETQRVLKKNVMDAGNQANVIYTTVIPWVSFTSLRHPVGQSAGSGIPLIAFGKFYEQAARKFMPVSLDVNHALMDGYHAGMFFEKLEAYFTQPHTISTPKR